VGVGPVIRIAASLDLLHEELKLAVGFPRRIDQLLVETLSNSPEACFDLIGSFVGCFQEGDSAPKGGSDLPEQLSDDSAPCAPLESGETLDDFVDFWL